MKAIKTTLIDTGRHGYLSVSQKDFLEVMGEDARLITGYSGIDLNRVYLEEDQDASVFLNLAKQKGLEVDVKSSYNEKFSKHHNFDVSFLGGLSMGDHVVLHDGHKAEVTALDPIVVEDLSNGRLYRVPKSNPFQYFKSKK